MGQTVQWTIKRQKRFKDFVDRICSGDSPLSLDEQEEYRILLKLKRDSGPRDWIDKCTDRAQKKKVRAAVEEIKTARGY